MLDRLDERVSAARAAAADDRSADLDSKLDDVARDLAALREAVAPGAEPVPRAQERLTVTD